MSIKKEKKAQKKDQDIIIAKMVHQLHVNLKRGLLPYSVLFMLKTRPHYSLEIYRKISLAARGYFKVYVNIIYGILKKFEQKGIVASYREKSSAGAKRKYYYLTPLGERLFEEVVIRNLCPVVSLFSNIVESGIINKFGYKYSKENLKKTQTLVNDLISE